MPASPAIRPLAAGNWKMNGTTTSLAEIDAIAATYDESLQKKCDLLVCPPATLVAEAGRRLKAAGIAVGGQNCHAAASGAFTGEISAEMLADAGASHVIVGHSERRSLFGETDAVVKAKAVAGHRAGLCAIVCVGETEAERRAGKALEVVGAQLAGSLPPGCTAANTVVAYEPVWAIGTGLTPTAADVAAMHGFIRRGLARVFGGEGSAMRVLYGGSVKPSNAGELMAVGDVNGALIGGASLKAADFLGIAGVYR